jgi:membrane-associated phospholipid phosphatase
LKSFLKNNLIVLIPFLVLISTASYYIFSYDKKDIYLFINQFVGNKYLNLFFYYVTYIGDGRFAVFLLLGILIYNLRLGIVSLFSFLLGSIISSVLKYTLFDDEDRPHLVFETLGKHDLNVVEGLHIHIHNSFPSGHATQAFAILMCLAFATGNKTAKFVFLLLAVITAASRVYLSQHWLADITAGSLIGMFCSVMFYFVIAGNNKLGRLNKPLADMRRINAGQE